MGVTYIPANPNNTGNMLGTVLGKFIGGALERDQAEKDRLATLKATEIINNMGKNYQNFNPSDQQKDLAIKASGYEVGQNPYQKIGELSGAYDESAKKIAQLQSGLNTGADDVAINNQILTEQNKQKEYGAVANKYRAVLAANKLSLDGFGSGDNASASWNIIKTPQQNSILTANDLTDNNNPNSPTFAIQPGANGLAELQDAKSLYNKATTDDEKSLVAKYASDIRGILDSKGVDYNALGLGSDGDGSQYKLSQNQDAIQNLKLTPEQLMNVQQVSDMASKKAAAEYLANYNPSNFASSATETLLKAKIDPKIIEAVKGNITEQAKNIGMQYAMGQDGVSSGDYSTAAKYAISHGMADALPLFQNVSNKYATTNLDTGGSIVPTAIVTNAMGAVPKSGTIGGEYVKTLTPEGKQHAQEFTQTLEFNKNKFNKEFELQKQQFGNTKALQWAQLQLTKDKLTLDQKEHIAGKIRAGIAIIQTKNESDEKRLKEIYANSMPGQLTPDQQSEVGSLKTSIEENNSNLAKYSYALDESLGMPKPTPQQAASVNYDSAIQEVTNALRANNAKRKAGQPYWNKSQFKDYMLQKYGDIGQKVYDDTDFASFSLQ